jgi:hypothetical protein
MKVRAKEFLNAGTAQTGGSAGASSIGPLSSSGSAALSLRGSQSNLPQLGSETFVLCCCLVSWKRQLKCALCKYNACLNFYPGRPSSLSASRSSGIIDRGTAGDEYLMGVIDSLPDHMSNGKAGTVQHVDRHYDTDSCFRSK